MLNLSSFRFPLTQAVRWLSREVRLIVLMVLCSIGLALSEGLSVTLLIPALDSNAATNLFSTVPGLRVFGAWVNSIPEDQRLLLLAGLLAVGITIRGVMQFASQFLSAIVPLRLHEAISTRCYSALVDADLAYMPERNFGEMQAVLRDHPLRASSVLNGLLTCLISLILVGVFGVLMLLVSWQMTIAAIVFIAIAYAVMRLISKPWFAWAGQRLTVVADNLNGAVIETIHSLGLIKLRAAEPIMKRRFHDVFGEYKHVEMRRNFFGELQSPVLSTLSGLFICLLLVLAMVVFGDKDRSWTGLFVFFVLCLYRLIGPATRLITAQGVIAANLDAFSRTEAFILEAERSKLANGTKVFERLRDSVRLERATLIYDADRGPAVNQIDMHIARGEIVAMVGASGAGKSSVLTLLMRLRDPDQGRVLLDGVDLRDYEIASWRRRIASVSQDIVLFNDSVRNNLTFGLSGISDDAVWTALREASADDFVRQLPEGLDAPLGNAGNKLSGGQRQRLALARALLSDPDLLILDEATSQLDSITEATIQHTIEASRSRRSILIVAHRLSTVRNADRIYVMEAGRVVQQGTHAELFATPGHYRRLFEAQQNAAASDAA